jgi:hypothetical protein
MLTPRQQQIRDILSVMVLDALYNHRGQQTPKSQDRVWMTCQHCGRDFVATHYDAQRGRKKYCSIMCRQAARIKYPLVEFNGKTYCYHPPTGYYYSSDRTPKTLLHRDMWEHYHGPIPKGMDIHHKDRNRIHNVIENLEIIDHAEHAHRFPRLRTFRSITCPICGRTVTSNEKRIRDYTKYCSSQCAAVARSAPSRLSLEIGGGQV